MSDTKFTQGPWLKCSRGESLIGIKGKDISVYNCGLSGSGKSPESVANAHLIKASPDMYNKLKEMSELLTMLDPHTHASIELDCVAYDIELLLKKPQSM